MRPLALLRVVDIADDDGDDQVAFVGDGDALGEPTGAVPQPVMIELGASEQVGDADAAALPQGREAPVHQVDIGDAVDLLVGHDAGVAIAAESELGPDIDIGRVAAPGAPRRPGVGGQRPGHRPPARAVGRPQRHPLPADLRQAGEAEYQARRQRHLDDRPTLQHRVDYTASRPAGGKGGALTTG